MAFEPGVSKALKIDADKANNTNTRRGNHQKRDRIFM
jgi:hypothetical protein